jgi:hypothetical protein
VRTPKVKTWEWLLPLAAGTILAPMVRAWVPGPVRLTVACALVALSVVGVVALVAMIRRHLRDPRALRDYLQEEMARQNRLKKDAPVGPRGPKGE